MLETLDEFRYLPTHHEERSRDKRKKYFKKIPKFARRFWAEYRTVIVRKEIHLIPLPKVFFSVTDRQRSSN